MDTMLATIGIVVKEPWAEDISFEMLNYTLYEVEDGGDGCGYIALKDNIGVTPGSDETVWRKAVQAGQSIYDLAVKYKHFVGTEEEFEAQYQAALQAALVAAAGASAVEAQVEAAEALRVQAESSRESAETARAAAESARATAEASRDTAESSRASAESSRASAETGRSEAETARQSAETTRQSHETAREGAEASRTQQFQALKADMQVAIGQADAATAAANTAAGHAAPYIGENGHWYRWDTTTSAYVDTGEKAVAPVLTADNDGVIYADGTQLTDVLKTTAAAELAQEGTSGSVAGDGTRWGAYKAAEASRDTAAQAAEGTSESAAGASNRWGAYKTAEAGRDTARETAEGSSSSVAGDGSRWGAYKTAEAARDTAAASAEGTSSASAGDANRWGAYKTAENARDAARLAAEGTSSSEAGDGTRWGAYKTAEAERSAAMNAKADKDTDAVEGNLAEFDANGNPVDSGEKIGDFAKQDGYYEKMGVGIAKNLEGRTAVTDAFFARTTGGEADISNGTGQLQEVKGNSQVWNQLLPTNAFPTQTLTLGLTLTNNGDGSYTINGQDSNARFSNAVKLTAATNHKVLIYNNDELPLQLVDVNNTNIVAFSTTRIETLTQDTFLRFRTTANIAYSNRTGYLGYIDLTLLGIDNLTTVEEVEAWLAENVGLFDNYPYNPGSVVNVNMTGLESSGQNLLNPTTGKVEIIGAYSEVYGNYYGIVGTHGTLTFVDSQGNESTITPDSDGKFLLETHGTLTVAEAGADCSVFHWWDGSKTDYTEYGNDVANLDVTHIWGRKNGTGDRVRVWPTGMPGLGSLQDMLTVEGGEVVARRKMGEVDMGSLAWERNAAGNGYYRFLCNNGLPTSCSNNSSSGVPVALCAKYIVTTTSSTYSTHNSKFSVYLKTVYVVDDSYSDAASFKTAMSGVKLYYELATPEVYTDLVYMGSSLFADGTPVTLPINYNVDNWGDETVLPRNSSAGILTAKPTITSRYSIDAVETLDTHGTEIENLHEQDAVLDAKKPNKAGEYNDFVAGAAKSLIGSNSVPAEFIFRKSPGGKGVVRIDKVKGKSVVWNQLVGSRLNNWTATGYTKTAQTGSVTFESENGATSLVIRQTGLSLPIVSGHKYLLLLDCSASIQLTTSGIDVYDSNFADYLSYQAISFKDGLGVILSARRTGTADRITYSIYTSENHTIVIRGEMLFDLTLMFGAGNEPSTVAEFEAMYPLPYYAYNAGQIVNNGATAIEAVGFNQWDEEWEIGTIAIANGQPSASDNNFRCKNFIPIIQGGQYYLHCGSGGIVVTLFYDGGYEYLGYEGSTLSGDKIITIPAGTKFIKIRSSNGNATYNHDICINISDPSRNGTYEPYKKVTLPLNIPTLTGKLNGEGESVVIASDGLRSAGTAKDVGIVENGYLTKIVKYTGKVDLGQLPWVKGNALSDENYSAFYTTAEGLPTAKNNAKCICAKYLSQDNITNFESVLPLRIGFPITNHRVLLGELSSYTESTLTSALSGVELIYELAEPVTYLLDTPIPVTYEEESGSTERRLPDDTASAVNAALALDITYPMDAVKQLNDMPKDYTNVGTLDSLLSTLGTALNGTITKTWDATNQKYTFTFTPNA